MILVAAIGAALSAAQPPTPVATGSDPAPSLSEISQALDAGRLEQARLMLGKAMSVGVKGPAVDRLLADFAFESGKNEEALARYQALIQTSADKSLVAERAAIAALRVGDVGQARPLIVVATESPNATWRAWNARGVIADFAADWPVADAAYERAMALAPDRVEILNNRGWSQILRGNWQGAIDDLERAIRLTPASSRTVNNLELARAALAHELPKRNPGESGQDWAERLNDAGMAARIMGNQTKAVAAFTQALEASGSWYARAANNLQAATASR